MIQILTKLFQHPKKRFIYAITGGKYLGELLAYITQDENNYCFLSLPQMKNRVIPKDKFTFGLKEKIVDVVEKMPRRVFFVCYLQYKKNVEDGNTLI